MTDDRAAQDQRRPRRSSKLLESAAAAALLSVVVALGWTMLAAYQPTRFRLSSLEAEVLIVISLLVAALSLVSIVALRHTQD